LCQRYYCIVSTSLQSASVGYAIGSFYFPVTMRIVPSSTNISAGSQNSATVNSGFGAPTNNGGYFQILSSGAGGYVVAYVIAFSAEL